MKILELFNKRVELLVRCRKLKILTRKQLNYFWDITWNENPSVPDSIKEAFNKNLRRIEDDS